MVENLLPIIIQFFSWPTPLYLIIGSLIGTTFGFLPGLGGIQAMALLIPLTYSLEPNHAIIAMVGCMAGVPIGGAVTSILINTPGTAQNAATCLDGFPLTQKGKAGYALAASASSSALGGILGAILLISILPFGKHAILAISYPEIFMLGIMGISVISSVTQGSLWKGIMAGGLGFLLTTVGCDIITGTTRFTFGIDYLFDGFKIVPVTIGLFALAEITDMFLKRKENTKHEIPEISKRGVWQGLKAPFIHFGAFFRSSVIGAIIGIIPGVGGAVSNWMAYGSTVKAAKDKSQFGKGDVRGVIAPQAADCAKDGAALIPTVIFGIPGSVEAAILMGAMLIHGYTPGPQLGIEHPEIAYVLIIGLVLGNFFVSILTILGANILCRIVLVPIAIITPLVYALALIGAYATDGEFGDVVVAVVFGVLGYLMKRFGFSRVPMVIALVLGEIIQQSFQQTMLTMGWQGFVLRPASALLLTITILMLLMPYIRKERHAYKEGGKTF